MCCHPGNPLARVNLGNLLFEDDELEAARWQFRAALETDPDFAPAHQGLARVLAETAEDTPRHWANGFAGHAVVRKPHRGPGAGVPILLLVSIRGGNIPTRNWIDDRCYAVTIIYTEFFGPYDTLPPHRLIVNAIGEADLCREGLAAAEAIVARSVAPVVNPPTLVKLTGRVENACRLGRIDGVVAPRIRRVRRDDVPKIENPRFPLLVRVPGRHTGRHFQRIENRAALIQAVGAMPGPEFLLIDYLDARGGDGLARKYRAMIIGGRIHPLHLAISANWKVHYFTSDMAQCDCHRREEHRYLADMQAVIGRRAMQALRGIGTTLGLDYAGVDFGLAADGSLLLFEANATMVVNPAEAGALWDYRRATTDAALTAARGLLAPAGTAE